MSDRKPNSNLFKAKERAIGKSRDAAHEIANREAADRRAKSAALKAARLAKEKAENPTAGKRSLVDFEITEQDVMEYLRTRKLTRPGIVKKSK